jgi:Peptidase family S41/N-terminal domain of Peptidase_S41 in eukaryotic IRBP
MRRRALFLVLASMVLATGAPAPTQPSSPPSTSEAARLDGRAVVAEVRRVIAERYVLPERRPVLDAALARALASGRYDVGSPADLAERINADLAEAGRDRHLNFAYHPEMATRLSTRTNAGQFDSAAFRRIARENNHGVRALRVLPGNVRYLDYDAFLWVDGETPAALDTAIRFLAGGDAVIIDLRRNGGGSPQAVQYLVSHFLPADRPLVTFYMNGEPSPDRLSTLAELPAGRLVGRPLYVLTSPGTASAAEEFTGHVAGYRIGEIVGETTSGAGFRNEMVPIAGGFVLSVSVGRAVLASTGRDWEAVGHAPTIRSPVPAALDAAHAHALGRLAAAASGPERTRLEAMAEGIAARSQPGQAALPLTAYAGRYGERHITVEGDRLVYRRGERPAVRLVGLGGHRFAFDEDPVTRLTFQTSDDRVTALEIQPAGGAVQGRYERTP